MSDPILVAPGEGELIGDAPDRRVEILGDHPALHATWSRFAAGRDGADLHVHHRHTDLFYVLEGELTLRLGLEGDEVRATAGNLVRVPPLVVHGFRNGSGADVRYLNLHAPGRGFADFMRALRDGLPLTYDQHDPPADGGRSTADVAVGWSQTTVDRPGLRAELLADADGIAVSRTTVDPGNEAPQAGGDLVSIYVLEGDVLLTLDGRELPLAPGTWAQLPPGVPHTCTAAGPDAATFLQIAAAHPDDDPSVPAN